MTRRVVITGIGIVSCIGLNQDEVLVSLFIAPKSYTGENVAEVSCHGSQFIIQRLIQLFVDKGARLAQPGEFTLRAFLNGRMDLSQAEAVADLIASSTGRTSCAELTSGGGCRKAGGRESTRAALQVPITATLRWFVYLGAAAAMLVVAALSLIPALRAVKRINVGQIVRERAT